MVDSGEVFLDLDSWEWRPFIFDETRPVLLLLLKLGKGKCGVRLVRLVLGFVGVVTGDSNDIGR